MDFSLSFLNLILFTSNEYVNKDCHEGGDKNPEVCIPKESCVNINDADSNGKRENIEEEIIDGWDKVDKEAEDN